MADRKQAKRFEVRGPVSRQETGEHETLTETGVDEIVTGRAVEIEISGLIKLSERYHLRM